MKIVFIITQGQETNFQVVKLNGAMNLLLVSKKMKMKKGKMKTTGIIRRIDDLGRVVIPKEIRRNLGIKEGDALEIYVQEGSVTFVPYRAEMELKEQLSRLIADYNLDEQDNEKFQKAISELKKIEKELE